MNRSIGRVGLLCLLAAASPCVAEPEGDNANLNLQCYDSTSPSGQKLYNVFWLDFKANIVTIGSASAKAGDPDNPALDAVSRTVPLKVTPEAFAFEGAKGPETINRKSGVYALAGGKQERCWKGSMPVPSQ
jgi:hypothetical protein